MTKQLACIYLYFENIMMIEVYTMGLYWQCFIHSVRVLVKWHIHGVTFMSSAYKRCHCHLAGTVCYISITLYVPTNYCVRNYISQNSE